MRPEKIEPKDGSSVVTTIDIDLQDVAEKALFKQLVAQNAHAGTVVLMEVNTGEVKAIVNLTDTLGAYREYYNYAVGLSSEPGSTFKLPAFIAAWRMVMLTCRTPLIPKKVFISITT
jgi:cell division protein FtsI (penicillin-binding protein 3)